MKKLLLAVVLIELLGSVSLNAQQIYWKKDHIYVGPGGKEIATVTPTPTDQTAPTAPSGLNYSQLTPTSVQLSWTGSTDAGGSGLAGYKVYRGNLPVGTTGPGVVTFKDEPLQARVTYTYTVAAFDNAQNHSASSTSVSVTTPSELIPPTTPGNLQTQALKHRTVRLDWTASTDSGGSGLAGYKVYRNGTLVSGTNPITTLYFEDSGLIGNTLYSYTVTAVDNDANASSPAGPSSVATPWFLDKFNEPNSATLNTTDWTSWYQVYAQYETAPWQINNNRAEAPMPTQGDKWYDSVANVGTMGSFRATFRAVDFRWQVGVLFWATKDGPRYRVVQSHGNIAVDYYSNPFFGTRITYVDHAWGAGQWVTVVANSATRNIKVYLDSVLVINFTETITSRPNTGSIGITANTSAGAGTASMLDDFKLEPLDLASPYELVFSDSFTRLDSVGLNSSNWVNSGEWQIVSNFAQYPSGSGSITNSWSAVSVTNFEASVLLGPNYAGGINFWGDVGQPRFMAYQDWGVIYVGYYNADNTLNTLLASITTGGRSGPETLRVEATSATRNIKVYLDGVLRLDVTDTNTSHPNSGKVGMMGALYQRLDDWVLRRW